MKKHLLCLFVCVVYTIGWAQTITEEITPIIHQQVRKSTAVGVTTYSANNSSNQTLFDGSATSPEYKQLRYRFVHPNFVNGDIQSIILKVKYSDYEISNGASTAFVRVPYQSLNNSTPWSGSLSEQQSMDAYNAIIWGDVVFQNLIGTASTSAVTENFLLYDQGASGFPGTTLSLFNPNSTSMSIAFQASAYSLTFQEVSLVITYNCESITNPPSNFSTSMSSETASLDWSPVSYADYYEVYKDGSLTGTTTSTSYEYTGLTPNTSYSFKVRAVNDCNSGPFASTSDYTCAEPISGLSASGNTTNSIVLNWNSTSGTKIIKVNGGVVASTNASNQYTVSGLSSGTNYNLSVEKEGIACNSDPLAIIAHTQLEMPSGLVVYPVAESALNLEWNAVQGATSYKIYDCSNNQYVGTSTSQYFQATGLQPNTTYEYKVVAINGNGASPNSFCSSGTTFLSQPQVTLVATSTTSIDVSWGAINNADSYEVYDCSNTLVGTTSSTTYSHAMLNQASLYGYRVKALSLNNQSLSSVCESILTLPEVPTGLSAVAVSSNSIELNWTSNVGPFGSIEVYDNSGVLIGTTTSNSFVVNGLSAGQFYSFKIRQITTEAESAFTPLVGVYTLLDSPQNLTTSAVSQTEVKLEWDPIIGATSYSVYECNGTYVGSTTAPPGTANATVFIIPGLTFSTQYSYKVKAINSNTESDFSACEDAYTSLPTPTGLVVNGQSSSEMELIWNSVQGATGYNIYSCAGAFIGTTTSTNFTVGNLSPFVYYNYKVMAVYTDPLGNPATLLGHANSNFSTCAGDYTDLAKPTNLQTNSISQSEIELSWGSVPNATHYIVANCSGSIITTTTSTSYVISGLQAGNTYEFKVHAFNALKTSAWSDCISGITVPPTPVLSILSTYATSATLSWSASNGATGYNLYTCFGAYVGTTTNTTYTINGLTPLSSYQYKVQAVWNPNGGAGSVGGAIVSNFSNCVTVNTTSGNKGGGNHGMRTLQIGELESEFNINVYPNPNDGMFDVEIEGNVDFDAQMQVFDMMGREVHSSKMNSGISFASAKVDMREHNPGYYIVKVTTPEGVYTKQFVKQ